MVGKKIQSKTRGHYPATPKALAVVVAGAKGSIAESLHREKAAIAELLRTEACRNLVRVFLLRERSKNYAIDLPDGLDPDSRPFKTLAVIGAGVMGAGIAQWCSARGQAVILKDINPEQVGRGMASIAGVYGEAVKRRVFTKVEARQGVDRIFPTSMDVPLRHMDLIIEAAVEHMDSKKKLFSELAAAAGPDTVLATNTSALSISEIAENIPHPERVIGVHFFNPVHRMQLVEVVSGLRTDPVVVSRVVRFVQKSGKLPVVVKDSPGFVVNRILMPYLSEAGFLASQGADFRAIDKVMLDFGMPMGPIRLTDEVGVDVCNQVASHQAEKFGDRVPVPEGLDSMVQKGLLGRKGGAGFYRYGGKGEPVVNEEARRLVTSHACANMAEDVMQRRMVLLMVNEAACCMEERLVVAPDDIDFAMIFGTGFAPFRGGPLRYADGYGIARMVEELKALETKAGGRFTPCNLLETMAKQGQTFYPV